MQATDRSVLPNYLQKSLLFGVLVALALVIAGRLFVPATSLISTTAASAILLAYGGIAALCPIRLHRRHPEILRWGVLFGLLAGAVFAGEIILEYVLLPTDNRSYGIVEFGAVFALYFASAFASAYRSRSIKNAALTSVTSAFIASLIWVITVLAVFYAFRGSPRQALVLRAEGDYEDFARSGMSDFNTYIMEDFMGAAFFHLLLGLLVAAVLGFFGGVLGKTIRLTRLRVASARQGAEGGDR
jgi:heme/copper-type cytochrome/quinol oxidase subunit 3